MSIGWIELGLIVWALGALFVMVLLKMAGDQDRAARHAEMDIVPHADVTITRSSLG